MALISVISLISLISLISVISVISVISAVKSPAALGTAVDRAEDLTRGMDQTISVAA